MILKNIGPFMEGNTTLEEDLLCGFADVSPGILKH